MQILKHVVLGALLLVLSPWLLAAEYTVPDAVKARLDPLLTKSGGDVHYFEGPDGMIGIGVNFLNGKQMVVYATASGKTLFSGVAIDVESGANLASADIQKLPAPNYSGVVNRLTSAAEQGKRSITYMTEGNPESKNRYFVFVDPTCGFCHKTYSNFLKVLADGGDLVVHYVPVGILGPEAQNLAKEMLGSDEEQGLDVFRKLVQKQQHLTTAETVAAGAQAFDGNMSVFRELGFSGVPAVVSDVGGRQQVRSGMITAESIQQETRLAAVKKVAMAD